MAFDEAGMDRKLQLQELEEILLEAYENSKIYKEKVNRFHDSRILRKEFHISQKVLLFNSRLKLILVNFNLDGMVLLLLLMFFSHGAVEIKNEVSDKVFKVNLSLFMKAPQAEEEFMADLSLVLPILCDDVP